MHRYWKDLFPEDFKISKNKVDNFHKMSILKSDENCRFTNKEINEIRFRK